MLKRIKATRQLVMDGKWRFEELSRQLSQAETDNVVPFRPHLHSRSQYHLAAVSLAQLEAENAALRNLAVDLALEIRGLYDGKERPQA